MNCLSYITKKSDNLCIPCEKTCCRSDYPFCKNHIKRRFTVEQFNQLDFKDQKLICSEILVTGKNIGKCCSKIAFRSNICFSHLQNSLTKCYAENCNELSFYKNGLCKEHCLLNNHICPCPKHSLIFNNFDYNFKNNKIPYYCPDHGKEFCRCLSEYVNKYPFSGVILPDDIIEYIFRLSAPKCIFNLRCLNKYYKSFNYHSMMIDNINIIGDNIEKKDIEFNNYQLVNLKEENDILNIFPKLNNISKLILPSSQISYVIKLVYKTICCELLASQFKNNQNYFNEIIDIHITSNYKVFGINPNVIHYLNNYNPNNLLSNIDIIYNTSAAKNLLLDVHNLGSINFEQKEKFLYLVCLFYKIIISNLDNLYPSFDYDLIKRIKLNIFGSKNYKSSKNNWRFYQNENNSYYEYFNDLHDYLLVEFSKRSSC